MARHSPSLQQIAMSLSGLLIMAMLSCRWNQPHHSFMLLKLR